LNLRHNAGLIEYLLVFGSVLGLAVYELVSVVRSQRRDRRILNGNSARTQADRKRSNDKLS
jgi:hypothetical protein